jgi:hypothetical protein
MNNIDSLENSIKQCLLNQLEISWQLLQYHLNDLTLEECLWQPTSKGIFLSKADDGTWKGNFPESESYETGPPNIAWLTWHIDFWWSMVLNHSFGDGNLKAENIEWKLSVAIIKNRFEELKKEWIEHISNLSDSDVNSGRLSKWPIDGCPFSDIIAWLNLELMKNAAEIGYVRFLYANRKQNA